MASATDRNQSGEADIRARIASMGQKLGPDMVQAAVGLFAADQPRLPSAAVSVERDIEYGPHSRNRLDVFGPASETDSARPVLLFIHGGGFTSGDKLLEGTPFYDNVGLWAVENGFIGVTMTYRLAPEHQWPAAVEDVAQAVAWLRGAIAGRGGDPERLFVMGHSAGAVHAASYVARPEFHPASGSGVAGAILVSGIYNIATSEDAPILETYYGTDRGTFADRSTVPHFGRVGVPVMVAVGEYDPPDFTRQALELVRVLFDRDGRPPRFVRAHGHNHYTEIMAFNLPYSPELARQILDFVNIDCSQSYK